MLLSFANSLTHRRRPGIPGLRTDGADPVPRNGQWCDVNGPFLAMLAKEGFSSQWQLVRNGDKTTAMNLRFTPEGAVEGGTPEIRHWMLTRDQFVLLSHDQRPTIAFELGRSAPRAYFDGTILASDEVCQIIRGASSAVPQGPHSAAVRAAVPA